MQYSDEVLIHSLSGFPTIMQRLITHKKAIRASNAWYQAFPEDIEDSKTYAPLTMPVISIGSSGYEMLAISLPGTATDLQLKKVNDSGHFILAEQPEQTAEFILAFLAN